MTDSTELGSFDVRRTNAARAFLRTVVVVDDRPVKRSVRQQPSVVQTPRRVGRPQVGVPDEDKDPASDDSARVSADPDTGATKDEDGTNHELDGDALQIAFAEEGLICSILSGEKLDNECEERTWIARVTKIGSRADVLILDWSWHGDHGEFCTKIIQQLVSAETRMKQLVVIYTAENDKDVFKLKLARKETTSDNTQRSPCPNVNAELLRFRWPNKGLDVVIVQKEGAKGEAFYTNSKVSEKNLPDRIIKLFGENCGGLLANAAMHGLAQLRESTHRVLRRFRPELDAPYVVHRACTLPRSSAQEQVRDLLVDALADALTDSTVPATHVDVVSALNDEAVRSWLDTVSDLERKLQATEWLRASGIDALANGTILDTLKKKHQNERMTDLAHILDKPEHNNEQKNEIHYRLAELIYCGDDRNRETRTLTLGTIIKAMNGSEERLVCILPACDSERVSQDGQKFPFMPLKESGENSGGATGSMPITVPGDARIWRVSVKVKELTVLAFSPKINDSPVRAEKDDSGQFVFNTSPENPCQYIYIGRLRPMFAQRLAQEFSATSARVGVMASEFVRRDQG